MPTLTSKFGFSKPLVNNATDADLWGGQLNTNWDDIDGLLAQTTSSKTADFNVTGDDFNKTFLIDASGNTVGATLPSTIPFAGFAVRFKAVDIAETITIDGNGNTIDGAATIVLGTENEALTIVSDGTNWQKVVFTAGEATTTTLGLVEKATPAEVVAQTADKYPDAADMRSHNGIAKAWCVFNGGTAGTNAPLSGYGVTSVTRNAIGDYTVNLADTYTSTDSMCPTASCITTLRGMTPITSLTTTTVRFATQDDSGAGKFDPSRVYFVLHGILA